ncbi:MAG TPA: hypothetical protein VMJ35_09210 [Dongiaceae bacterium]|nr:hypothetical protein [Dongiaceae bacterium]
MSKKSLTKMKSLGREAGVALLTTLMLLFLMSSLLVGFAVLLMSNQQLAGSDNDDVQAFYGAEAGMEELTAGLGNLFAQTYAPSMSQISALQTAPPAIPGIAYQTADGHSGYVITPQALDGNGNPAPTVSTIKSGPYVGMNALITEYTLTVNARTSMGREVKLQRSTQTVGIPMFQFGVFSDMDLTFHAGPDFSFGGRTHTNGNLFLAEGTGATLTMKDKVDAYKDVIRTNLADGWPSSNGYAGTVNITTNPGGTSYRSLAMSEGSLTAGANCTGCANTGWPTISMGAAPSHYNSNLINGPGSIYPQYSTGARQLNLGIVTMGTGSTQAIDLIRRPVGGEAANITGERYFAQASLQILLSDNPSDIMNLPCVEQSTQPLDLSTLAQPVANWPTTGGASALKTKLTANGVTALPLAASGAATNTTNASAYNSADGYWLPYGYPIVKGFIKIQAQTTYGSPCGTWQDVTAEVLGLGYVGRNINPQGGLTAGQYGAPTTTTGAPLSGAHLPGAQLGPATCADPHPNAIIRLERVRDNPSTWSAGNNCGALTAANPPSDFWPNTLFDTREGELRETVLNSGAYQNLPTLNGTMHYIELDAGNLVRWFSGAIGSTGPNTKDQVIAPNDFVVYISDRRGNYASSKTWSTPWPPVSPSGHETGEYGWNDIANGTVSNGCQNASLDPGEDLDGVGLLFTYGANSTDTNYVMATAAAPSTLYGTTGTWPPAPAGTALITGNATTAYGQYGFYNSLVSGTTGALLANNFCGYPSYGPGSGIWPMSFASNSNAARENPPIFFRRAVKIVNGKLLTGLGSCPSGTTCGLTIATENPLYIQGNYNANSAGGGFNDPHVPTSVAADAITLLSNNWNDINSFSYAQYNLNGGNVRNATTTYWRTAAVAGKGIPFPYFGSSADNGSDGGIHNFLRYIEDWSNQTLYYTGSLISMYYNRQATGIFKCCATVYAPPTRGYQFDVEFLNPTLLPPRTPLFRDTNTTGWTRLMLPSQ